MKARGSPWEEEREKTFFFFLSSPTWLLFFYFCYFYWGTVPSGSLCDTDSLWWTVLFTATESVELFILFTYTNATHKYLNRFFSLAERQISQSKNSALFQIHEMCLNKLIIIKIFCGHDNLMPVETRSAFASTSFFLFLSVFLHF